MNNVWNFKAPYPAYVLPDVVQDFIHCTATATKSSAETVGPAFLSAAAASIQALVDVKATYGSFIKPTSLNVGVVLRSGEHKSAVRECLLPAFEEFEQGLLHDDEHGGMDLESLQYQPHQFIAEKASEAGVINQFRNGAKSIFFAPDEGIQTLQQLDMAAACKRYDGSTIRSLTRKDGAITLPGTRTSVCLLIQDKHFSNFMKKKGDLLIESGFMPRTLMSFATHPASMRTQYSISPSSHKDPKTHPVQGIIRDNLKAYARSQNDPAFKRTVVTLNTPAEMSWNSFYQETEQMLMYDPSWESLSPFVRRAGENALRLAAVLQCFSSPKAQVEKWAVDAAVSIVKWHLAEAKNVFGELPIAVKMQQYADTLYHYLQERASIGIPNMGRSYLLRCAPAALRKADRLDLALHHLLHTNRITVFEHGKKEIIAVNRPRVYFDSTTNLLGDY